MKVRELIELLSKLDQEAEVVSYTAWPNCMRDYFIIGEPEAAALFKMRDAINPNYRVYYDPGDQPAGQLGEVVTAVVI